MDVALVSRFRAPFGGAERSLFRLAEQFASDHDVTLYYLYDGEHEHDVPTEQLPTRLWGDRIDEYIPFPYEAVCTVNLAGTWTLDDAVAPDHDLVVTQHEGLAVGARMHQRHGCPHFVWLHDDYLTVPHDRSLDGALDVARRLVDVPRKWTISRLYDETTAVLANSEYTADRFEASYGEEPEVLYPFVDPERVAAPTDEEASYVLHVGVTRRKGADVTLEVARRLPDEEFVFVGRTDEDLVARARAAENVTVEGWVDAIADAYAGAKALLMPSRWPEPFGMTAVEASLNGIPTIGSDRGGLPEAIGVEECVVPPDDVSEYATTLESVLSDREAYGRRAREHATRFVDETQYEQFASVAAAHGVPLDG